MARVAELYKLEDHIRECGDRYDDLEKRIDAVDERLLRIEQLCLDIKNQLSNSHYKKS